MGSFKEKLLTYHKTYRFKLKRYMHNILTSDKSDHLIATSYAIGSAIALFPTPGFSTAIGLAFLAIFKKLNKVAVLLSMLVWNAVTVLPIYWLSYKVGENISSTIPPVKTDYDWINSAVLFFKQFIMGNLVITIPLAIISYFVARAILKWSRERRRLKKAGLLETGN